MREDVKRCIAVVVEAVNRARVGAIIDDSEEPVRQATAQSQGQIAASLTPEQAKVSVEGPTRLYVGTDGVKVPMVTTEEKAKRRARRGPKRPGSPRRQMHRGADNTYKEFKIATFYDESNEHRQAGSAL